MTPAIVDCPAQEEAAPEAALQSFETAMAIDPRHSDAEIRCGALYRRRGQPGDLVTARSLLVSGLKHKPNSLCGWYNLGLIDRWGAPIVYSYLYTGADPGGA